MRGIDRFFRVRPRGPRTHLVGRTIRVVHGNKIIICPASSSCTVNYRVNSGGTIRHIHHLHRLSSGRGFTLVYDSLSRLKVFTGVSANAFQVLGTRLPKPCAFVLGTAHRIPQLLLRPGGHAVNLHIPDRPVTLTLLTRLNRPLVDIALVVPNSASPVDSPCRVHRLLRRRISLVVSNNFNKVGTSAIVGLTSNRPRIVHINYNSPTPFVTRT